MQSPLQSAAQGLLLSVLGLLSLLTPTTFAETHEHVVSRPASQQLSYRCLVTVPPDYEADRSRSWPMILFLHGGGTPEPDRLLRTIRPLTELPAIVVAPICPLSADGPLYTNWDWTLLGKVVREMSGRYRVDGQQRSVIGFSMGGSGAWELPFYEPELFAKSVVIAGVCHPWSQRHYPKIPVWAFVGADDFMRKEQQETVTSAKRFGVDVVETVWQDADHGGIFRKAMRFERMLSWLVTPEDLRQAEPPTAASGDGNRMDLPRYELQPLPDRQLSFRIDGVEKTRWHFGEKYPRPFFYPFKGPSGGSLSRMGHPGAPDHDHHRSIWFAHFDVDGENFWAEAQGTQIRREQWYAYQEDRDQAIMASRYGWYDRTGKQSMQHDLVAAIVHTDNGELTLEIQLDLQPAAGKDSVTLGKTNFGFLAVRVAKSISAVFGGGHLSDSEGRTGEEAIFGKRARWMDYSGPLVVGTESNRRTVTEGITYFDHPDNPRYPTHWHVRDDGWMGASFCMQDGWLLTREKPLRLRYLLHAHAGGYDQVRAASVHAEFASRSPFVIEKSSKPHRRYHVRRAER